MSRHWRIICDTDIAAQARQGDIERRIGHDWPDWMRPADERDRTHEERPRERHYHRRDGQGIKRRVGAPLGQPSTGGTRRRTLEDKRTRARTRRDGRVRRWLPRGNPTWWALR